MAYQPCPGGIREEACHVMMNYEFEAPCRYRLKEDGSQPDVFPE